MLKHSEDGNIEASFTSYQAQKIVTKKFYSNARVGKFMFVAHVFLLFEFSHLIIPQHFPFKFSSRQLKIIISYANQCRKQ